METFPTHPQMQELNLVQEQLAHQVRLFDTVLSAIVDFAYTFDREGRFTYINQALLDLWQLKSEEALGKTFSELNYPEELAARLQEQVETVFRTGQTLKDETPYTGAAGTTGYYEYIFVPVFGKTGEIEVVAGSTRDISERHLMEEELRDARARLVATLAAGEVGTWTWDIRTDTVIADKNLALLFSVSPDVAKGGAIAEFIRAIHSEDRARVERTIQTALQSGGDYEAEYRLVQRDGSVRWVIARGRVEQDEQGTPLRLPGVVLDITDRKRAEQALEEHAREIEVLNHRLHRSIQETHHRVKNNLQIISSLAELQAVEGEETIPASALHRIGQHTRSLAALHDILTQQAKSNTQTNTIETQAAMNEIIPLLESTAGGRRIHYQVENIELPGQMAASLALLVSEIVSNAIKHGRGDIELTLTTQQENARLEVCDDGPGFPPDFDWQKAAHTGLSLIENTGRYDLRGSIAFENRETGGARVVVVFPLSILKSDATI